MTEAVRRAKKGFIDAIIKFELLLGLPAVPTICYTITN